VIAAWWQGLAERERRMLAVGAAVVALLLGWSFVWYPLAQARDSLQQRVARERTDLAWMQQTAGEFAALRSKGARAVVLEEP